MLRYEIRNIAPPRDILEAMEKQMRAEREKRALILSSEGDREAAINRAEGDKQQVIKASEARKQQQINEADGEATAILTVARATGDGLRAVADAIQAPGGHEAVQLRVAEQYIDRFGELAKAGNTLVLPANLSDVGSMLTLAMNVILANLGTRRPRDRLLVGDLRLSDVRAHLELAQKAIDDDLQVQLPLARDERLTRLGIGRDAEGGILDRELLQRLRELFLVGLALRLDHDLDHRLRRLDRFEDDRRLLIAERVASEDVL